MDTIDATGHHVDSDVFHDHCFLFIKKPTAERHIDIRPTNCEMCGCPFDQRYQRSCNDGGNRNDKRQ